MNEPKGKMGRIQKPKISIKERKSKNERTETLFNISNINIVCHMFDKPIIAKGLATIFIVLGHIDTNKIILYSFHLQIFMFVSGYLYKERNIGEFAKRKFKTVIIPYLFFGILEILYFYIVEARFRDYIPIKESILGLVTGNYDWLGFNVHLWYLPFFFVVCNMYNILENL